ncbi:hypothetical protein WG906_07380 [Pedobacter sp. P351]|uniref:hypothetical protein n=1 Tax=Pedobacter superstes TaxID=3133441 RepID=UPI0030B446BF
MKTPKKKFDNIDSLNSSKTNLDDPIVNKRLNVDDDDDDFDAPLDDDLGGFDDLDSLDDDDDY